MKFPKTGVPKIPLKRAQPLQGVSYSSYAGIVVTYLLIDESLSSISFMILIHSYIPQCSKCRVSTSVELALRFLPDLVVLVHLIFSYKSSWHNLYINQQQSNVVEPAIPI